METVGPDLEGVRVRHQRKGTVVVDNVEPPTVGGKGSLAGEVTPEGSGVHVVGSSLEVWLGRREGLAPEQVLRRGRRGREGCQEGKELETVHFKIVPSVCLC